MPYVSQKAISLLREAAEASTLKNANFGQQPVYTKNPDGTYTEHDRTEFIRENIKLHHESWVTGYINWALRLINGEKR